MDSMVAAHGKVSALDEPHHPEDWAEIDFPVQLVGWEWL